jgi:hypothetical protein
MEAAQKESWRDIMQRSFWGYTREAATRPNRIPENAFSASARSTEMPLHPEKIRHLVALLEWLEIIPGDNETALHAKA